MIAVYEQNKNKLYPTTGDRPVLPVSGAILHTGVQEWRRTAPLQDCSSEYIHLAIFWV